MAVSKPTIINRELTCYNFPGCGGNANRFVSIKNCYKLCHPYYRQRFIRLGLGRAEGDEGEGKSEGEGGEGEGGEGEGGDSSTEGEGGDSSSEGEGGDESSENGSESEDTSSEATTEEAQTEPDQPGMLYYRGADGKKEKIKPEIQVVHE